jgi:hypothetical protein
MLQIGLWEAGKEDGPAIIAVLRQMARRHSAAFQSYVRAATSLGDLFTNYQWDSPNLPVYFNALDELEMCLINLQIVFELMNKSSAQHSPWISGSDIDACIRLTNSIKHFGERRGKGRVTSSFPVWLETEVVTDGIDRIEISTLAALIDSLGDEVIRMVVRDRSIL